ncbi:glycosyltransferase [Brevibacillus sp. SYSU BS000544]|uniref:glycosyltransferase n=1 Tax=Brevibacillus sp. SYSU BS000544 TaxID=3416443 RepID=UPI003CE4C98B
MKQLWKITFLIMAVALIFSPIQVVAQEGQTAQQQCLNQSAVQLKENMRKLWTDHAVWTRNYIVSAVAGMKDQKQVLARLLRNQQEIGNAIKPYYGDAAGNRLAELLKEHILIAGQIVDAAKKGDQARLKKSNTEWYRNADDITEFLSSANPNWPKQKMKELWHTHLQQVADILTARLKKDWDGEIIAFDKGLDHLFVLADTLSEGIMKQFPDKF